MILKLRASEDLIHVTGALVQTWWVSDVHAPFFVGFSDGTGITCRQVKGVWRFLPQGTPAHTSLRHQRGEDSPSDTVELEGLFTWVVGSPVYVSVQTHSRVKAYHVPPDTPVAPV